jgi:hypothetical protein
MWHRVNIVLTDVSEERIASIYRVEEVRRKPARVEPVWAGANRLMITTVWIVFLKNRNVGYKKVYGHGNNENQFFVIYVPSQQLQGKGEERTAKGAAYVITAPTHLGTTPTYMITTPTHLETTATHLGTTQ